MTTSGRPSLSVRPDLETVPPYVSPQQSARYRMNTNESPYAPPDSLVKEVAAEIEAIALNRYPDRDARKLYESIAAHLDHPTDGLWVANGSNEVFMHLFLAFGGPSRSTMVFEPTYSMHSLIPKIASTTVVTAERSGDFTIDTDRAVALIGERQPEIVIVCSPNNPTGACEPAPVVRAILDAAPGLVVVDEAYIEFSSPGHSVRHLLDERPNLIVTKTFSKAWRLAGVRIGYMLADPELIGELARVRLPYHLSAITQVVGEAAIRHADETLRLVEAIATERDRIADGLRALKVKAYPSDANFILFEVAEPDVVWKRLLERDVLVRNYSGTPRLEGCLRVTAGLPEETEAFLGAMGAVLA